MFDLNMTLLCCVLFYIFLRAFHLASLSSEPRLMWKEGSTFVDSIIKKCPLLTKPYVPPLFWGKSGHIQTAIYAKLGRVQSPYPHGERQNIVMSDGATMTFDIFEPLESHSSKGDFTIMVCPGIANSSETSYIRCFVNYAQEHGYRVACLNHLGAIFSDTLTSPRMFNYGGTEEFHEMVQKVKKMYLDSKLIACGFSMGGNIVMKYLGEQTGNQDQFICALSLCQGYDVIRCSSMLIDWVHMRRGYLYAMTAHQKKLLRAHRETLLTKEVINKHHLELDRIFAATSLLELDEQYNRRVAGFDTLHDYYSWCSCAKVLNKVTIPTFFLNSEDDPIVPTQLHVTPELHAKSNDKSLFAVTRHGGHLGYFEGHVSAAPVTWLDKVCIEYIDAVTSLPHETVSVESAF